MNKKGAIQLPAPAQIALVVKDREKAREFLSYTFGIGPWLQAELEYPEIMVRFQKSAYRVALASFANVWAFDFELVQPISGNSLYSQFLGEGNQGLQHVAFDLTQEGKKQALKNLKTVEIEEIQGATSALGTGASFSYLNTDKIGGAIFEVRYRPSKKKPPMFKPVPMDMDRKPKVKLPPPSQIGIVVKDLDRTAAYYSSTLGFGPWRQTELEFSNIMVRGKKSAYKIRVARTDLGGIDLKLIQPISGNSLYSEFLDKGREGFHHLTYDFSKDEIEKALKDLKDDGIAVIQGTMNTSSTSGGFAYLNTDEIGGCGTIFKFRHNPA